ncbi:MAG TPA: alpha-amylase family glycosyl hydrolase, partial [Bacteroidales bacterium]|nr:alpha-amylase family glycosyl hydrolase [Bacteroidales bacterium]
DFKLLVDKAHAKGLKVIKDMVFNHFGTGHWWMNDLPMKDWINQWPEYTRSNFRSGTLMDPHVAEADREKMLNGWFDKMMADLNQTNPLVAKYLIQNSIWWVEFAGLDGIRMDTYPYSEKNFMAHWMQQLRSEYPNFSVVGEVWLNSSQQVAYWHENNRNLDGYNSKLNYVFDFPLKYAIGSAFNEGNGWSSGASKLYETLSFDFLYDDPQKIINFADNHDGDRIFSTLGKDLRKLKMAMTFLMTTRGAPQIYYGTEILMTGWEHDGHGFIREDFPGGWDGDTVNAFTDEGLSADQKDAKAFMKLLMNWRKQSKAVTEGKLKHYIPEEGVYVYFRYTDDEAVMVVINNNEESRTFKTNRFAENLQTYTTGTDILHRTYFDQLKMISVPAMSARIIELKK